jgi:hypothetical protein
MNLPIGALSLVMVIAFLHVPHTPRKLKIDWWGAAAIIMATVPLLLLAEQGRSWGWTSPLSIAMGVTGVVGIVLFILIEKKMGESALIPLAIFKSKTFARTQVLGFIIGAGMFGGMIVIPLIIQIVYGVSPTLTGLMMLPMVFGMMVATITAGRVTAKTGKYRFFFNTGTATLFFGYLYMVLFLEAAIPLWVVAIGMVLVGLGLGQLMQTTMVASQNSVEAKDIGVATSSATFFRQMGGTLGVAIFMSMLFSQVGDKIAEAFKKPEVTAGIGEALNDPAVLQNPNNQGILEIFQSGPAAASSVTEDSSFLIDADERLTLPFRMGFVESSLSVFLFAGILIGIAFVISWFIKEVPLREKSASQEVAEQAGMAH